MIKDTLYDIKPFSIINILKLIKALCRICFLKFIRTIIIVNFSYFLKDFATHFKTPCYLK